MVAEHLAWTWIQTHSGLAFSITDPQPEQICITDIAHALSNLCRFCGHTKSFYSVAQHSVLVSQLVPREFALAGLLHDAAEAYLGDVTSPVKKQLGLDYEELEWDVSSAIAHKFGVHLWNIPEVKKADLIALVTERRDLLSKPPQPWQPLPGVEPDGDVIVAVPPPVAYGMFMTRWRELQTW